MLTTLALLLAAQAAPAPATRPLLICRKVEKETGTHIRTGRRCKTAEEWAREDEERTRMAPSTQITEGQRDPLAKTSPQ